MTPLLLNLLLAAIWAGATGEPTVRSFTIGFVVGYLVLLLLKPVLGQPSYFGRVWRAVAFLCLYLWDLVLASLRIAHDVLTPRFHMRPGVVRLPLDARTDIEITVLANLLSLTPGTLSLAVSRDRSELFLHVMFIDGGDVDRLRASIKQRLERRVLRLMRDQPEAGGAPAAGGAPGAGDAGDAGDARRRVT